MINETKKITVSIGIPAYNEEANIKNLIIALLNQKQDNFILEKIIVVSDGSIDGTVQQVLSLSVENEKIVLINDEQRKGKPARINEMFDIVNSDIFIQLDADVLPANDYVISELVKPFLQEPADMVYGNGLPKTPVNLLQKVVLFGVNLWSGILDDLGDESLAHRCVGRFRAFGKNFYSEFRFPPKVGTIEDTYSFYYAMKNSCKVVYNPKAEVFYMLPLNIKDYGKQIKRSMNGWVIMGEYFDKSFLNQFDNIDARTKLKGLFRCVNFRNFFIAFLYILLQIYARVISRSYKHSETWEISKSTKNFKLDKI